MGNTLKNMYNEAIAFFDPDASTGCTISGNNIYNCAAGIAVNEPTHVNNTICCNTITECGYGLILQAAGNFVYGNVYVDNTNPNTITSGNIVLDQDTSVASPYPLQLYTGQSQTVVKSDVTGAMGTILTSGASAPWTAGNYLEPIIVFRPADDEPGVVTSLTIGVGYPSGPLTGCVVELTAAGPFNGNATFGDNVVATSAPFTIPQTVGSISDPVGNPSIVIPLNFYCFYYTYNLRIITPGGVNVDIRYAAVASSLEHCGYVVGTTDTLLSLANWDFLISGNIGVTITPFLILGEQGNNKGQMALGPNGTGTPLSKITMYNTTGTWPSVPANNEAIIGPITATGAVPTDQIFISTTGALPGGLTVGGAYCNADGEITFKVLNVTTSEYTGAGSYNLWFQGISQ